MEWLLKIVEGPMNGAEIALVGGLRVRVGSGADCDIVLADASLPETAFELDVSADSVSLICGEDVRPLVPFEIFESGTSGFAIGPAEGAWEPLKSASSVDAESSPRQEKDGASSDKADSTSSSYQEGEAASSSAAEGTLRPQEATRPRRSRGLLGFVVILLLILAAVFALWLFWPKVAEPCPKAEPKATLADIASQYSLVLTNYTVTSPDSPFATLRHPLLKGNLARKTERMAIRSLALSEDPHVRFELTDDETLHAAASELLFVVTEGAIKVASATNGVVTLFGFAPSVSSLERTVRALDADVKGVRKVVASGVTVGGPVPVATVASMTGEKPMAFPEACPLKKAPRARGTATVSPVRDFPIAGILTKPYPMVVMNNGMRLVEGAQIADVTVERIEADKLIMKSGSTTFEWKP